MEKFEKLNTGLFTEQGARSRIAAPCAAAPAFSAPQLRATTRTRRALSAAFLLAALCVLAAFVSCKHPTDGGGSGAPEKKMVRIVEGSFQMGDKMNAPVHTVTLTKDFLMSNHEVTQAEWMAVFGAEDNPSEFKGDDLPVESVSWYAAIAYCNKRSIDEGFDRCYSVKKGGNEIDWKNLKFNDIPSSKDDDWNKVECNWDVNGYRLPTEAEWEYAARGSIADTDKDVWAGTTTESELGEYAWCMNNSYNKTHPIMTKLPNDYGLYDMSGNVFEWCWDWYGNYTADAATDPTEPTVVTAGRVVRGGSFIEDANVADRGNLAPDFTVDGILGFRVVRTVTE
ncbi:MAG: SUMF1/EgtB/PvdO family nonheme iron enzyme [Treponema sp.]|nr:SUMF1/EgtB/PvdO family nonheme iron enzyme [Treponema sp.]